MDLRHLLLHPRPDRRCCGSGPSGRVRPTGRSWGSSSSSAFAAIRHRQTVTALEVGRREEAESFARILSSLSRSVSPDAILGAIVDELATATGADHIVVARRRPDARVLEATLVSARPGVPDSTTRLPIADLEDPVDGRRPGDREPVAIPITAATPAPVAAGSLRGRFDDVTARLAAAAPVSGSSASTDPDARIPASYQAIADRIAMRTHQVYGLSNTLAAPLTADDAVIGAIVLSSRTAGDWPADDPPPAVRGGGGGVLGHVAGLLAPGGRDERLHGRADRPARTAATSTSSAACSPAAAGRATRSAC